MSDATAVTTIENVSPNSVTLSTNAKGSVQVEVKVYDASEQRAAARAIATLAFVREHLKGQLAE
jgi:hypothetical protein